MHEYKAREKHVKQILIMIDKSYTNFTNPVHDSKPDSVNHIKLVLMVMVAMI